MADWAHLEEIVRRVVREELAASKKPRREPQPQIRLNGKGFEGISEDHLSLWRFAYPKVNIQEHIKLAAAWCKSNPDSAPRSKFGRFLNTWFKKEQNAAAAKALGSGMFGKPKCARCSTSNYVSLSNTREGMLCEKCRETRDTQHRGREPGEEG